MTAGSFLVSDLMGNNKEIVKMFSKQLTALITTAFGLVAALAWNTAIQSLFQTLFGSTTALVPMFSYALLVTLIAIVAIYYVSKLDAKINT